MFIISVHFHAYLVKMKCELDRTQYIVTVASSGTDISVGVYREAVRLGQNVPWICANCVAPQPEPQDTSLYADDLGAFALPDLHREPDIQFNAIYLFICYYGFVQYLSM